MTLDFIFKDCKIFYSSSSSNSVYICANSLLTIPHPGLVTEQHRPCSQTMDNLSLVLVKTGVLELQNIPIGAPGHDQVQVAIHSNGICHTDVAKWQTGYFGDACCTEQPTILGHESSGIIVKLGRDVKNFSIGDRVALEAGIACRVCDRCSEGKYNLCRCFTALSMPETPGSLANYVNHPADFTFRLPYNVSLEEGALAEPLAIAVHAARRARVTLGSRILITGAGTIGTMCLLLARTMGVTRTVITDITDSRLRFAERMGASKCISARNRTNQQIADEVNEFSDIDITLECSGAPDCVELGIKATKRGGTVCMVGILPRGKQCYALDQVLKKELEVIGSLAYANCYPLALDLIAQKLVDVKQLVTHRYPLREAVQAFERAQSGDGEPMKILVTSEKCADAARENETYHSWIKSPLH